MKSADLTVRISILSEDATTGTLQWEETHSVTTNEFGVFTLKIGTGEQTGGSASAFSDIQWGSASHFLKVGVNDGSGYVNMGTTQLLSVPYAMYSEYAASSSSSVESSWVDGVGKVTTTVDVGIGTSAPAGKLEVQGDGDEGEEDPLFEVKRKDGQTVFAVYTGGVRHLCRHFYQHVVQIGCWWYSNIPRSGFFSGLS
ncbi:hypothetical protein ES705_36704 [subsurface metagenome]